MTGTPPTGDRPEPENEPTAPEPTVPTAPATPEPAAAAPETAPPAPEPAAMGNEPAAAAAAVAAASPTPPALEAAPPAAPPAAQPAWQAPPAAPPKTPEVPGAPGRYFAATVTRVAALLIDTLLLGIVIGIVGGIAGALAPDVFSGMFSGDPREIGSATLGTAALTVGGAIVSYLYFFLSWRSAGRATPGQRVFKMQVGNAFDGAALDARQITIRWLTLFGLGLLAVIPVLAGIGGTLTVIWDIVLLVTTATSLTKQGIHDRWAGSAVVATGPQNTTLAWGCLIAWIVGIVLLVAITAALLVAIVAALYNFN